MSNGSATTAYECLLFRVLTVGKSQEERRVGGPQRLFVAREEYRVSHQDGRPAAADRASTPSGASKRQQQQETPGDDHDDFQARLERMRKNKAARKGKLGASNAEPPAPPSAEPRSKRLKDKRSKRLVENKFGREMDWAEEEEAGNHSSADDDKDLIVDDEEHDEEEEELVEDDGLPSDEEEAVESGAEGASDASEEDQEEGSEEEDDEESAVEEDALDKVVGERTVGGELQYRVQWAPSMEKTWMAADATELRAISRASPRWKSMPSVRRGALRARRTSRRPSLRGGPSRWSGSAAPVRKTTKKSRRW